MSIIELEKWKPSTDDPRKLEYAGGPQMRLREVLFQLVDLLALVCYTFR